MKKSPQKTQDPVVESSAQNAVSARANPLSVMWHFMCWHFFGAAPERRLWVLVASVFDISVGVSTIALLQGDSPLGDGWMATLVNTVCFAGACLVLFRALWRGKEWVDRESVGWERLGGTSVPMMFFSPTERRRALSAFADSFGDGVHFYRDGSFIDLTGVWTAKEKKRIQAGSCLFFLAAKNTSSKSFLRALQALVEMEGAASIAGVLAGHGEDFSVHGGLDDDHPAEVIRFLLALHDLMSDEELPLELVVGLAASD